MKRRKWNLALILVLIVLLLAGCGSSMSASPAAGSAAAGTDTASYGGGTKTSYSTVQDESQSRGEESSTQPENGTKLIRTAQLQMETTDFDGVTSSLNELVSKSKGYFESTSIQNAGGGYRTAAYTVRVPAENLDAFLSGAGQLCHMLSQSSNAQDVSENYYDTQGRLKTQQTKLERLQTLLAKAEKMEDIITLESAISDTEQTIDDLSGTLQHYDSQVNDSTVTISLNEVYKLSNVEEPTVGFFGRVGIAFASGWKNFTSALESIAIFFAYGWPWILLLAAAAAAVIRIESGIRKKKAGPAAPSEKTGESAEK